MHPTRVVLTGLALFSLIPLLTAAPASGSGGAPSPFVREHATAGVQWSPWSEATFARAKTEKKPLFVHIGFFTSELSRAMARQSFSHAENAKFLNENFVCVLVDRDEQPEVAAFARAYLQHVKQMQGWPANLWLTSDLKPFEGATYLPPSEEWGKPGLMNVAKQVAGAWQADAAAQEQKADEAVAALAAAESLEAPPATDADALRALVAENVEMWRGRFDATNGGFGDPPKRLEPELLRFLLRDPSTRDMALLTLRTIAGAAVCDPIDGGFFRQAGDAEWKQPTLQKTAADQVRIALAYLDAAKHDSNPLYADTARRAIAYLIDHLHDPKAGYLAAEDATGETLSSHYLWSLADVEQAVGAERAATVAKALGITPEGNIPQDAYPGLGDTKKSVPYRASVGGEADPLKDMALVKKLLAARAQRATPRRDGPASSGIQGLVLCALTRGAAELNEARFRTAAQQQFAFIRDQLTTPDGAVRRVAGRAGTGSLEDAIYLVEGLRRHAVAAKEPAADTLATAIQQRAVAERFDPTAGRFFAMAKDGALASLARVHVPAPGPGELPAPEPLYLIQLARTDSKNPAAATLVNALALEARDSPEPARGEVLLAFAIWLDATRS